jgi:hypothetical protein
MATKLVPSLQQILYRLVSVATEESLNAPASNNPGRFPVVVRPETRAFLEAQASYLGGSIAGVAGAILDGVAMSTQGRETGVSALKGIADRFGLLIQEHGLSVPAAVEALEDLGLELGDFASTDALQRKLSSKVLRQVAERFFVEYDWLAGKSEFTASPSAHSWYKSVGDAAATMDEAMQNSDDVEFSLYLKEGADLSCIDDEGDWSHLPHFIPVLKRSKALPGGESLDTYQVWDEGRWSYWRCRHHIKLVVYFAFQRGVHVRGGSLAAGDYDALLNGRSLPVTVINRAPRKGAWHPDDYVLPGSAVAKDAAEWKTIEKDKDNAATFKLFKRLLSREASEP